MSSFSLPPLSGSINFDTSSMTAGVANIAAQAARVPGIFAESIDAPAQQVATQMRGAMVEAGNAVQSGFDGPSAHAAEAIKGVSATASEVGQSVKEGLLEAQSAMALFPAIVVEFIENPLLGAIGVALELGKSLVDIFLDVPNHFREIGLDSLKSGLDPETFSTFAAAANAAGVATTTFTNGLELMQQRASAALSDDESAAKGFERLGISARQLAGMLNDPKEMILTVADAMKELPTQADRINATIAALGRGGKEMLPFLQQGRGGILAMATELGNLGARVGTEETKLGETWAKIGAMAGAAWDGIKDAFAQPILQFFQDHIEEIIPDLKEVVKVIQNGIREAMNVVFTDGQNGGSAMIEIVHSIKSAIESIIPLLELAAKLARKVVDAASLISMPTRIALDAIQGVHDGWDFSAVQDDWRNAGSAASDLFSGGDSKPQVKVDSINITMDSHEATSQIAAKILPAIRDAHYKLARQMEGAAAHAKVGRSFGGRR